MAKITAKGKTMFGYIDAEITGSDKVESIKTGDEFLDAFFWQEIRKGSGKIANNYRPAPETMLQAYAFCMTLFEKEDISVDGDIGEIEFEEGVIY